ncbi:PAS domain-containing protein [Gulbenkiania mobilis]|uniref:PAS domain-containing protein n=1 Tax=Gulbenkiania mobilis TaxID=397457 RepID=UPI000A8BC275|nr:PAS domain-containing protein [Gulbenkiania mobilis]
MLSLWRWFKKGRAAAPSADAPIPSPGPRPAAPAEVLGRLLAARPGVLSVTVSDDGRVMEASPAFCQQLARPLPHLFGQPLSTLLYPDDAAVSAGTLPTGRPLCFLRPDGAEIWLSAESAPATHAGLSVTVYLFQPVDPALGTPPGLDTLAQIAQRLPQVFYLYDLSAQRISYLNDRLAELLGYPAGWAEGHEDVLRELVHPDDASVLATQRKRVAGLRDGETLETLYRLRHADGRYRWFHAHEGVFSRLPEGTCRELVGTAEDITEKLAGEARIGELEQSSRAGEQRLQLALAAGFMGAWEWDLASDKIVWESHCRAVFGLDLPGYHRASRAFMRLVHPADRRSARDTFMEKLGSCASAYRDEFRIRRPDGQVRWIATHALIVRHLDGQVLRVVGITQDITERRKLDETLWQSESRYRGFAESVPQLLWATDAAGQADDFNRRWFEYTGLEPCASYGSGWLSVVHPEDLTEVRAAWCRAVQADAAYEQPCRLRHHDGSYRWHLAHALPVYDAHGRIARWFGSFTDIDEQKRLAEALQDNEYRLLATLDGAQLGTWTYNPDTESFFADVHAKLMHGFAAHALLASPLDIRERIHPDDLPRLEGRAAQAFASRSEVRYEYRVRLDNGELRWISAVGQYAPRRQCFFGIVQDITDTRRLQDFLAENLALLDTLLENAPEGVAFVDRDFRYVRCNLVAAGLTGRDPDEIIGKTVADVTPHLWPQLEPVFRAALETGQPQTGLEVAAPPIRPGDAVRTLQGSYYPVFTAGSEVPIGVGMMIGDITARKRAEEELLHAKRQAEEANTAKDHFLAVLSHELRTPLTPVLLASQLMEKYPDLPRPLADKVAMIRRNVGLEIKLIDDLLDLTHLTRGSLDVRRVSANLHDIIRHAAEICAPELTAKHQTLVLGLEAGEAGVMGDAARLQQVLWNLLKNSIKFTPEHGRIMVDTFNRDGCIVVEVRDTGLGIDPHVLPRVFDAFEQGGSGIARQYGGLGLGLAISRALTELHDGTLTVHSDGTGKGATFTLTLPLEAAPLRHSAGRHDGPSHGPMVDALRILMVEDHADSAEMLALVLRLRGWQVDVAATASEGLALAQQQPYDVLVSDLGLPDESGLVLVARLRSIQPDLVAVALSGYGKAADIEDSRKAGFALHLTKPVRGEDVERSIEWLVAEAAAGKPVTIEAVGQAADAA